MFDRCGRWRHLLNQRADARLTPKEQHALDAHLTKCSECRNLAEADEMLHHVLGIHTGILDDASAKAFDDHIVDAIHTFPALDNHNADFGWSRRWRRVLPFPFLGQLMAGGIVAASLTIFSLFGTLHPTQQPVSNAPSSQLTTRNEPSIPLETLLSSPSPRAALLWRTSNMRQRPAERTDKPESSKLPPLRVKPKVKGASLDLTSHVS